jgi:hypothetical protein
MTAEVNEKLGQFLNEGQNWEKKSTNLPGVSLLKLPYIQTKSTIYSYRDKPNRFRYKEKRNNN